MPDQAAPFGRVIDSLDHLLDRAGLMLAQNDLAEGIIAGQEDNIVAQYLQEPLAVEERLDLALVIERTVRRLDQLLRPVEQVLAAEVPGDAVEKVEQLRHLDKLRRDQHLGRLALITADLVYAE